jgi:hypothetical protein
VRKPAPFSRCCPLVCPEPVLRIENPRPSFLIQNLKGTYAHPAFVSAGWLLTWLGMQMFLGPLAVLPDAVPCIGPMLGATTPPPPLCFAWSFPRVYVPSLSWQIAVDFTKIDCIAFKPPNRLNRFALFVVVLSCLVLSWLGLAWLGLSCCGISSGDLVGCALCCCTCGSSFTIATIVFAIAWLFVRPLWGGTYLAPGNSCQMQTGWSPHSERSFER